MKNGIFDLDGTLVDSLEGIEFAVRNAIKHVLPEKEMPDLRTIVGPPIASMFAREWPELSPKKMARLLAVFREQYVREGCYKSRLFPGVFRTLERLHSSGMRLFVLTNKPHEPTRKILDFHGLGKFFTGTLSPDSMEPPFCSKPEGARILMKRFDLDPGETFFVGDGEDDAVSAEECGFRFIAAAYGYGTASASARVCAEKFSEIGRHLL